MTDKISVTRRGWNQRGLVAFIGIVVAMLTLAMQAGEAAAATHPSSSVTVSLSSTSAKASEVTYTIGFTVASGLVANSTTIELTGPSGITFPTTACSYSLYDASTTASQGCPAVTVTDGGRMATITSGLNAADGDPITVTVRGVLNPNTAGAKSLSLATSAGDSGSGSYTLTAPTSVSAATVTPTSTAATASAVTYRVGFTSTNGLTSQYSQIVMAAASGTTFSSNGCNYSMTDTRTGQSGGCPAVTLSNGDATVTLTTPINVNAGDAVTVTANGVGNPATSGGTTFGVSTSSDPTADPVAYSLTAPSKVSALTIKQTSTAATATEVTYTASFTATSALTANYSQVTLTVPSGATLSPAGCNYVLTDSRTQRSSGCLGVTISNEGTTAAVTTNLTINAGDPVTLSANGASNPAHAGSGSVSVFTTSDPAPASVNVTFTAPSKISALQVTPSSTSATATGVNYTADFKSTNGLAQGFSQITLAAGTGTTFSSNSCAYQVFDTRTGRNGGCPGVTVSNSGATVTITSPITVNPGDTVSVVAQGVANPSASGSDAISVSTTSDPAPVKATVSLTGVTKVTGLMVSAGSTSANATGVNYSVTFTTTNALTANYSQLVLTGPTGITFPSNGCQYSVTDNETGASAGCLPVSLSGTTVTITDTVNASPGDSVTIGVNDVTNPTTAESSKFTLTTTSDPGTASVTFKVVAPTKVTAASLSVTSRAAGSTAATYSITFTATGALVANQSTITLVAPDGTDFPADDGCGYVYDNNDDTNNGWNCSSFSGGGSTIVIIPDENASPGDQFTIAVNAVTNAPTAGHDDITLSTSSDPSPVELPLDLTAPTSVTSPSFTSSTSSEGATGATYSTSFVATGGLTAGFSTVTVAAPVGTVFPTPGNCNQYIITDQSTGQGDSCPTVALSNNGATATITVGDNMQAGDQVSVVINGISNPTTTGRDSVMLSTSSDTNPVSMPFTVTASTKVTAPTFSVTGSSAPYTYTVGFTSTSGLTGGFSTITVAAPASTVFSTGGCTVNVVDTTDGQSSGCLSEQFSNNDATETIIIGNNIRAGDTVKVTYTGVTGTAANSVQISTSSDPKPVTAT